jgi:hypothetical protein
MIKRFTPNVSEEDPVQKKPNPVPGKWLNTLSRFNTRRFWLWVMFPLLVLAAGLGEWLVINTKPIPGKYRQGLNFPLYYPANLPQGYTVDHNTFERKGAVLIFVVDTPNGKHIAVSEEHVPVGLDLSQHPPDNSPIKLPDEDNFTTAVGTAQISLWGANLVCSLVTPNTWIILNISGFTNSQAELVAQSFKPL